MSKIVAFRINGNIIECDNNCRPIKGNKRAKPRKTRDGELKVEKDFLSQKEYRMFNPKKCLAYDFMKRNITEKNVNWNNTRGFAEMMANVLGIEFTREFYRRQTSTMYWIEMNLGLISCYILNNRVEIIFSGGKIKRVTPLKCMNSFVLCKNEIKDDDKCYEKEPCDAKNDSIVNKEVASRLDIANDDSIQQIDTFNAIWGEEFEAGL